MAVKFPYQYVPEILMITAKNDVDVPVGLRMFLNNVDDADLPAGTDMYEYEGADHLDYEKILAANPEFANDAADGQLDTYASIVNEFDAWYREHQAEITPLWLEVKNAEHPVTKLKKLRALREYCIKIAPATE